MRRVTTVALSMTELSKRGKGVKVLQDYKKQIEELLDFVSYSLTVTTYGTDIQDMRKKAKEILQKHEDMKRGEVIAD